MDIFTQGIAGALLAQTGAEEQKLARITVSGFLAGMLADADILVRSADDPLLNIEFHRQFSHSLLFIPVGAMIAALLLWPLMKKHLKPLQLYLACLLGYSTSGLLDACTSFGTQLLWPFSAERISWNLISIVDPIFTAGLFIALILAWRTGKKLFSAIGISFALLYLGLGYVQHMHITTLQWDIAAARGHKIDKSVVKPTIGNLVLWRSVYLAGDYYYVDAIRLGPIAAPRFYTGGHIRAYHSPTIPDDAGASIQQKDLNRFEVFSQNYLVEHPTSPQVIGDIRYSMLPDSIEPLWGIRLDPENPDKHVSLATFRKNDKDTRNRFIRLVLGQ